MLARIHHAASSCVHSYANLAMLPLQVNFEPLEHTASKAFCLIIAYH